jgi:hypothetical protein
MVSSTICLGFPGWIGGWLSDFRDMDLLTSCMGVPQSYFPRTPYLAVIELLPTSSAAPVSTIATLIGTILHE